MPYSKDMTQKMTSLVITSLLGASALLAASILVAIASTLAWAGINFGSLDRNLVGIILVLCLYLIAMITTTTVLHTLIGALFTIVHCYSPENTLSINQTDRIGMGVIASCCAQTLATIFGTILIVSMARLAKPYQSPSMFVMFMIPMIDLTKIVWFAPMFGALGGLLIGMLRERKTR